VEAAACASVPADFFAQRRAQRRSQRREEAAAAGLATLAAAPIDAVQDDDVLLPVPQVIEDGAPSAEHDTETSPS
jgi:hypothetical protein